ncbi:MAG: hypothetical protein AB4372_23315 [Xenococcus sp. (in: cyanobacteria)]
MSETDKRAKANKAVDGIPNTDDLSRISHILYLIHRDVPTHYYFDNYSNKYISLHKDIGYDTGLVSYAAIVKTNPYNGFLHGYAKFAYRYHAGSIFYEGFFDCGIPSGECRFSIEGIKDCYGIMNGVGEPDKLKLSFYPNQ